MLLKRQILCFAIGCAVWPAVAVSGLRSPQVPIAGSALQNFFNARHIPINAATDQLDMQTFSLPPGGTVTLGPALNAGDTYGLYNGAFAAPPLYLVFPGAASTGWSATASFRISPTRLVVNLFDNNAAFVGSATYLAGPPDPTDFGIYVQGPGTGGVPLYTQDARNPGGTPQFLVYSAPGSGGQQTWLAIEETPGPGGDYADVVMLLNLANGITPASSTTWSRLKRLYQ
jgi:hypothetical protein